MRRLARGVPADLPSSTGRWRGSRSDEISYEFETIRKIPGVNNYHFYSVGSYNESAAGMHNFLTTWASWSQGDQL